MAIQKIILSPLNNFTLDEADVYNFVGPLPGNYVVTILNRSSSDLAIGLADTVGLTDPASYIIPAGQSYSASIWGPSGIWVAGTDAISVALTSR